MADRKTVSRRTLLQMPEMHSIKESLSQSARMAGRQWGGLGAMLPIRAIPLQGYFAKTDHSMDNMQLNPNLPRIMHERFGVHIGDYSKTPNVRETVNIPSTLVALKIADIVIEGAEPYSQWKEYNRVVDMPSPLFNVPKDKYTDWIGQDTIDRFKSDGGNPVDMGGQEKSIVFNCQGNNNYYRAAVTIRRNDIRDNKFLSVEQNLKNAGAVWYYGVGQKIITTLINNTTTYTGTKASLQLSSTVHPFLEALSNAIRQQMQSIQRNRADTIFINGGDAWKTIATATIVSGGGGGYYPFLDNSMLAPNDEDVVNNSGMAKALGLKRAWETPQISAGTVMIIKKDVAQVVGLYQDLEIEEFDMTVAGITNSALSMRFDIQQGWEQGGYKITSY